MEISLVVLSYNKASIVKRTCAHNLGLASRFGVEVIFVDNNSTDETYDIILSECMSGAKEIIRNERNLGVAAGRNIGLMRASGEYIIYADEDVLLDDNIFEETARVFKEIRDAGAITFRLFDQLGNVMYDWGDCTKEIGNFQGAAHAFRKEALEAVGFLDAECFFGGEEFDMSVRLRNAGYHTIYVPTVKLTHYNSETPSIANQERKKMWIYNYTRVIYKNFPILKAIKFSFNYSAGYILSTARSNGVCAAVSLVPSVLRGAVRGVGQNIPAREGMLEFYSQNHVRPEYGNVSLVGKIAKWIIISRKKNKEIKGKKIGR